MADHVWPGITTGPNHFQRRSDLEREDVASLQTELREQRRIARETGGVFDKNRVPLMQRPK